MSGQPDKPNLSGQPDREAVYERLAENLKHGDQLFQVVGADIEYLLTTKPKETYRSLSIRLGIPKSTLGDHHKAWKIAPDPDSLRVGDKTGTYSQCVVAVEAAGKVKRAWRELFPNLDSERMKLRLERLTRRVFEDAVTQGLDQRDLRSKYEKKAQRIRNRRLAKERAAAIPAADWFNRCHLADCIDILHSLPDGSIDFIAIDPPYWPYHDSQGEGGLRQNSYRATVLTGCANRTMTEAKAHVLRLIPLLPKKLTAEGTVLYWNTGFHCDDWEVVKAFEDAGLPNYRAGVWHKKSQAPTIQNDTHTTTFERWLIQRRNVKAMVSNDFGVSRDNFLTDEPLVLEDTMVPKKSAFYHLMEKPESIMESFLRAYCQPNSVVFSAYGCSGSDCCAAIALGHRFVYCELDKENFDYGSGRIAAQLNAKAA